MRNNFQALLLVILILVSMIITKETRIERSLVEQPASFRESVEVSTLSPEESAPIAVDEPAPAAPEEPVVAEATTTQSQPQANYSSSSSLFGNLIVNIPKGFLPKVATSSQILTVGPKEAAAPSQQLSDIVFKARIVSVSDLDTGNNLISYNNNKRWPLASITKLMTAVLAIEEFGKDKEIIASENAFAVEGNLGKLEKEKLYKVEDLLKILVMTSSNHAAVALADFYVFGQAEFVKLMNRKAAELGMAQTVFFDPAGLSPINQSTANDIKKLMKYIINNHPEILAYSQEKNFGDFKNINQFAGQDNFLGGKTGYLEEAKQNLVSLFSVDNRRILIIVLGAEDRFGQTQMLLSYLENGH